MTDKKNANVAFSPENYAFASGTGNITKAVNEIIDKVRGGQWVEAASLATDAKQLHCLYSMPDTASLDMACPVMLRHPDLAEKKMLGDLLACCRQCPRKAEYLIAIKHGSLRGKNLASATPAPVAFVKFTIKCSECAHEWDSEYFDERKTPLPDMFHAIAAHLNIAHGIGSVPHEMNPFRVEREKREEMGQV